MVRRVVVTGLFAAVLLTALLARQVSTAPEDEGKIRRLPLTVER